MVPQWHACVEHRVFSFDISAKDHAKKACRLSQLVRAIAESNASVKLGLTAYLGNNEDQQSWIYQRHKQQPSDRMGRPDTGSPRLWGLLS